MNIELKKFGATLISRQAGREAYAAFAPSLRETKADEMVKIDFAGVVVFSPSWGDEFLRPLVETFDGRLVLVNTSNPSVIASLETLEKVNNLKFGRD